MSRQNTHDRKNTSSNAGSNQRRGQKRRRKPQVGGPAADPASLLSVRSSLVDAEYIVFDIETTGGNPEKNGITEIFAVKYKNGEPGETFYSLVNPQIPIPPIVRRMTGINNQTVRDAPLIDQVMPGFVDYAGNGILVSHNTIGDMKFLRYFAKAVCDIDMGNFFLCTHLLVEKLAKEAPDKSLRGLAEHFQLDSGNLHRAEADAYVTLDLFKVLLGKLLERNIVLVEEAIRLQGDLDSGVRLGWGIPPERLENVPQQPGVFQMLDLEKKVLFASSSYHLEREIRKIRLFDQLPRGLLRIALKSYDLTYHPQPTFFAAMLAESQLLETHKLAFDPYSWHQRLMFGIMFSEEESGYRMSVGNVEPGVSIAMGPVRDRRQASEYIEAVASVFKKESTKAGVVLTSEEFALVKLSLGGELKQVIDREKRKRRSLKMWFSPTTRRTLDYSIDLMEALDRVPSLPRAESMLTKTGVLAFSEGKNRGNWTLYPIAKGRPLEPFALRGDLDSKLREPRQLAELKERLASAGIGETVQQGESHRINAALWMIFNGRSESRFFSISDIEKEKVEFNPPVKGQ